MKDKTDILERSRQIFNLPSLKDKIICFIGGWERTKITPYMPAEEEEKEYSFQEMTLFNRAKKYWQKNGEFSFFAFREFANEGYDNIDLEEIKKIKKEYSIDLSDFIKGNSLTYLNLKQKENDLIEYNIRILPKFKAYEYIKILKVIDKFLDLYNLKILCIDYNHFPYFVIPHFLKYMSSVYKKEKMDIPKKLKPLYQLFRFTSPEIKMATNYKIKYLINKAFENSLNTNDWDEIEFLSINHLQNIKIPIFFKDIKKGGYLCEGNINNLDLRLSDKREDIRFFYSFESLLFYEFKNCLKRIKRCVNCGSIIGLDNPKYKGRYCPLNSKNYSVCFAERNRKRQKKYYNLTKT